MGGKRKRGGDDEEWLPRKKDRHRPTSQRVAHNAADRHAPTPQRVADRHAPTPQRVAHDAADRHAPTLQRAIDTFKKCRTLLKVLVHF